MQAPRPPVGSKLGLPDRRQARASCSPHTYRPFCTSTLVSSRVIPGVHTAHSVAPRKPTGASDRSWNVCVRGNARGSRSHRGNDLTGSRRGDSDSRRTGYLRFCRRQREVGAGQPGHSREQLLGQRDRPHRPALSPHSTQQQLRHTHKHCGLRSADLPSALLSPQALVLKSRRGSSRRPSPIGMANAKRGPSPVQAAGTGTICMRLPARPMHPRCAQSDLVRQDS